MFYKKSVYLLETVFYLVHNFMKLGLYNKEVECNYSKELLALLRSGQTVILKEVQEVFEV